MEKLTLNRQERPVGTRVRSAPGCTKFQLHVFAEQAVLAQTGRPELELKQ